MGKQGLVALLTLTFVSGCAMLDKGANYADNPIVVGVVNIAGEKQCAQYAADHPEDAATLRAYLTALASAANGCVAGLAVTPTPAAGPTVVR